MGGTLLFTAKPATPSQAKRDAATGDGARAEGARPRKAERRTVVESRSKALAWEQLQALGYVDGTFDANIEAASVILHDATAAHPGYNFYSSRKDSGARLVGMDGALIHRWRTSENGAWQHAELLPNGDVLVIVKDKRLTRYDASSRPLWSVRGRFHHDLFVRDDKIYALTRTTRTIESIHRTTPILVDTVSVFSMHGELEREISILDSLRRSGYGYLLPSVSHKRFAQNRALDILHTNHVEVLDGSMGTHSPIYSRGNLLISMRNINAIAILDPKTERIVWLWGPTNLTFQHHPTMLDDGHILLFDNGVKRSRVIEIEPLSGRIVWEYASGSSFFSATRGSNQRLPNGNTLITESDAGYVFEVTPKGRVVWKFANPAVSKRRQIREAIWRMTRFDPAELTFLD